MFGYDVRDVDPGDRAAAREGNNGLLFAAAALLVLLVVIILVFLLTFTTRAYCAPGAPCDTAVIPALVAGLL